MMKLDIDTYIKALEALKITKDLSWREMERASGVHNISRIVNREIKKPTAVSWQALHDAYPNDIPEPIYIDGKKVYKNVTTTTGTHSPAGGRDARGDTITQGPQLSTAEQYLIDLLREHDKDGSLIKKFTLELLSK